MRIISVILLAALALGQPQPQQPVPVEQFGMCQCPMTSSWFSAFFDSCLKSRPEMQKLVNFTQQYVGGVLGGPVNASTWNSS